MTANRQTQHDMLAIVRHISAGRWFACKALGTFARRVYVSPLGGLKLQQRRIPDLPGDDWVLCKTRLGGICGTDLNMVFFQQHPGTMLRNFVASPVMLGHENVAEIARAGPQVPGFEPGRRVIVDPSVSCQARRIAPPCRPCQAGRPSICENLDQGPLPATLGLGYNNFTGGSWSEYFIAHAGQLHAIPNTINDEHAILIDPLACSLHAVLDHPSSNNERILVFGAGIIALGCVALLRAVGIRAHVTMTAKHSHQAELARRLGADHVVLWQKDRAHAMNELAEITDARAVAGRFGLRFLQGGFDRVYDCTGTMSGFAEAGRVLRPDGTLILVGTPHLGLTDLTPVWFRELTVVGATGRAVQSMPDQSAAKHDYQHIIELLKQKRLDIDAFGVQFYRQRDYRTALMGLRRRRTNGVIKAAFDFR